MNAHRNENPSDQDAHGLGRMLSINWANMAMKPLKPAHLVAAMNRR